MLVLEDSNMTQLSNAAQYSAWKGQLYIHKQLVCNIALQASNSCSIPAQLPQKLDLKEVIQLSELRKKLPEDIFQKPDLTGQEVSCGKIYYSLYPLITSDVVGSELDKLLKCLKDQDLALIKVLNDNGFLILVNSAVLQSNTETCDGNTNQLNALFVSPHQKFLDNIEREEWEGKFMRKKVPLTIINLLPGLTYAILESSKLQKDKALYPGPLVEQYFKKYAILPTKKGSSSERTSKKSEPVSVCSSHGDDVPKKCSPLAFSCLQLYVSSPVHFTVPLIKMSNILAENASLSSNSDHWSKTVGNLLKPDSPSKLSESKTARDQQRGKRAVREDKEQRSKKSPKRKSGRKKEKKRKSTRRTALTTAETSENRASNKRGQLVSEDKKEIVSSSKATIKLASPPYPQRRKRGAEVLTAAIIQEDEKIETKNKTTSSIASEEKKNVTRSTKRKASKSLTPEETFVVPSKRRASEPANKKTPETKDGKTTRRSPKKIKNITVEQLNPYSKSSENLRSSRKPAVSAPILENSIMEKRIGMYESHALNLLADLALNSFSSTDIPYMSTGNAASASEVLVEEVASTGDSVSSMDHSPADCSLTARSTTAITEPECVSESENDKPKNGLNVSPRKRMEGGEKHLSQKAYISAAKTKARFCTTNKINLEHSYSQLPIDDTPCKYDKETTEQSLDIVPDSTTPADVVSDPYTTDEEITLFSENVSPDDMKLRAVSKFQDHLVITFNWEPVYDFDLDSKFTSDPLEKTVNRALHGPWNPHLKEKVEDVRIILHMWLALFYSKPSKQITCSSRKVVEHSNPAKYVSINTVLDPFEFYEIMESDGVPEDNTSVILPMGKRSESLRQVNPLQSVLSCRSGTSESKSLRDLALPTIIPKKARPKDIEHKYSKDFSSMNEPRRSSHSQTICKIISNKANEKAETVKVRETVSSVGSARQTTSSYFSLANVTMPPITETADKQGECSSTESKTIHTPKTSSADVTNESVSTVVVSSENDENSKDLGKEDVHSVHSLGIFISRMPPGVEGQKAAETQDFQQASVMPTKKLDDHSTVADEPARSSDVALQSSEGNDTQMAITYSFSAMGIESPSHHSDVSTEFCMEKNSNTIDSLKNGEVLKVNKDSSGINHVSAENFPTDRPNTNVLPKSMQPEDFRQVGELKDITPNTLGPQIIRISRLEFYKSPDRSKTMDLNRIADHNSNCNKEGKTDGDWGRGGFDDKPEQAKENIPDGSEDPAVPKTTHKPDENLINEEQAMWTTGSEYMPENEHSYVAEITADDTMSRLELSNSSDEASDVESTTQEIKSDEQESIKILKESSEKSDGKEESSIRENEMNTSVEPSVPAVCNEDDVVPEKHHNVQETDVLEAGSISEVSMLDNTEKKVPEEPLPTPNIDQPCLRDDDDADLVNVAATEEETKESSEPLNPDANLDSDRAGESLPDVSNKEAPADQAVSLSEESPEGACLVDEPSSDSADTSELPTIASTSVPEELNIDSRSEELTIKDSVQSEMPERQVHEEQLTENQNDPHISPAAIDEEEMTSDRCSVEIGNEVDDVPGSPAKEVPVDGLSTNTEVLDNSVSLGLSENTLEEKADVADSNDQSLQPNIPSPVSDQLLSNSSEIDPEQQPVEKPQPDPGGDAVSLSPNLSPVKTNSKDSTKSSKNLSSNKKEILSKLKRICLGSTMGHQVSSSSENVSSQDKNITTEENNEVLDVANNPLPSDEDKMEISDTTSQEPAIEDVSQEESGVTLVDSLEPEFCEEVIPPPDNCLISPSLENVSDSVEQDPSPELPDICFIVNTGSISKEQYDRWSETSDDDIEFIRSYKEPLLEQEPFQEEIHESPKVKCPQEPSTTSRPKSCSKRQSGSSSGLYETDENSSKHLQDLQKSITNDGDVVVTRNLKDPCWAIRTINKDGSKSDLDHLFSDRRIVSDNVTQNTLDMENVRFMCKLKEILRKSSIDGPPSQTVFESRKIPSCSWTTPKSKSPILITVQGSYRKTDFRRRESWHPSTYSSPYYEKLLDRPVTSSRTIRKVRTPRYSHFHFSRLRYEKTLDKSNADISGILNECVQSNHLKLSSVGLGNTAVDRAQASQLAEEGGWQERRNFVPVSSKSRSVKNIISDVCLNLHSRLQDVARSSEQKISFYIYETDDEKFISSAKSLLVKDGHTPTEPWDFLNSECSESDQLLIIIKNEDVFSCINKIPYLMQLKLLPNVTFAGVDTPEDMTESTFEELFQAGGFVASDKTVLENLSLGKLKEVLAILEKMNRTSPWKWLIHYRENRKLKENKRGEAAKKISLLKSYQQSNVVEMLSYHQCDSRSKEPTNDLSCLLNLQYQHIHSRLAVYLTGTTSMVTEEYQQNGILVYDVDTFLRKIQRVDSQFQASYWS